MDFKFNIGDLVIHRAQQRAFELDDQSDEKSWLHGRTKSLIVLAILTRTAEECSGGIQKTYGCRMVDNKGIVRDQFVLHEHELEPAPVPKQ